LRLSEQRATNIGLLYPKERNNIGVDIPVDVPPTKILGDVSPASPAGLTPVFMCAQKLTVSLLNRAPRAVKHKSDDRKPKTKTDMLRRTRASERTEDMLRRTRASERTELFLIELSLCTAVKCRFYLAAWVKKCLQ